MRGLTAAERRVLEYATVPMPVSWEAALPITRVEEVAMQSLQLRGLIVVSVVDRRMVGGREEVLRQIGITAAGRMMLRVVRTMAA